MIVECWQEFGIDTVLNIQGDFTPFTLPGDYDAFLFWNIESWGGHPDLSNFLTPFHSSEYKPIGQIAGRNWSRWRNPRLDANIEEMLRYSMDDPRINRLGQEYIKIAVEDMFQIPISSYNVFAVMNEHYWTGYPDINNPYANPVANWTNTRYMYLRLRPTGRN
jgi:peptide/nickel transport system substrate-binding protein